MVSIHVTTMGTGQAHSGGSQARVLPAPASREDWPHAAPELACGIFGWLLLFAAWLTGVRGRRRLLLQVTGLGCLFLLVAACGGGEAMATRHRPAEHQRQRVRRQAPARLPSPLHTLIPTRPWDP